MRKIGKLFGLAGACAVAAAATVGMLLPQHPKRLSFERASSIRGAYFTICGKPKIACGNNCVPPPAGAAGCNFALACAVVGGNAGITPVSHNSCIPGPYLSSCSFSICFGVNQNNSCWINAAVTGCSRGCVTPAKTTKVTKTQAPGSC